MAAMTDNTRGALLMIAGQAAFTINDACMKGLSGELPLMQSIFLRGLATTVLLTLLAWRAGALSFDLPRRDRTLIAVRTVAEIGAAILFIGALFHMPLANASAILQSLPLLLTLAGALVLREAVGWRRLTAILVGLGGVMLIIRPGAEGFNIYTVAAFASVLCVVVRDLSTRRLSRAVPSLTVAVAAAAGVMAFAGLGSLVEGWEPVSARAWMQLAGATAFVILGYLCAVMVMRTGDIGFVAPFRYTALIWALALGFLAFGEWPDALTLTGAAIVAATGIFTLVRERRLGRAAPPLAPDRGA